MILNHLWQSTLAVGVFALVAFALRRNRAHVRYGLWLAASVKFLVPFALLVTLGNQLPWRSPAPAPDSPLAVVLDAVSLPFSSVDIGAGAASSQADAAASEGVALLPFLLGVWAVGCLAMLVTWLRRWRRVHLLVRAAVPVSAGRELSILRRLEAADATDGPQATPVTLVLSDGPLEPGVFGLFRPVLLWPSSISARLTDEQVEAILAHELAHVRRHDNLAAALHMAVQSVFWFHPVVWWIGARLVDERERSCDEDVIQRGNAPQAYAEGILKTCKFYVESPLACVSGVTGSDLKRRIEQIMRSEGGLALAGWRKALLATAGVAMIAGPIVAGVANAPPLNAQSPAAVAEGPTFAVASVKQNKSGRNGGANRILPGGQYTATNVTLRALIANAYGAPLQPLLREQIVGAPDWIDTDHFDIVAKAEGPVQPGPNSPVPLMIQALLRDRFLLAVHDERRELPIYALVMVRPDGRFGPQLTTSASDCSSMRVRGAQVPPPPPPPPQPGDRPVCGIRFLVGNVSAGGVTMNQFANALSRIAGRPVVDKTGLSGEFDLDLRWTPDQIPASSRPDVPFQPAVDPNGPSIFTAVQEQLGLKLQAQTDAVDVIVVDRLEKLNDEDEFDTPAIPFPPPSPPPPPPPPRP